MVRDELQRFEAIRCFPDDSNIGVDTQEPRQVLTRRGLVVYQ
jgi:hypothetical protein